MRHVLVALLLVLVGCNRSVLFVAGAATATAATVVTIDAAGAPSSKEINERIVLPVSIGAAVLGGAMMMTALLLDAKDDRAPAE